MGIDRRFFLKGLTAGAGVAAAYFNSPVARGLTATAPTRILLVPLQHGWGYDEHFQKFTGTEYDFQLPAPFKALEPIKDQCVFVDGVRGTMWGNAHDVSYSDIFTAAVPWGEGDSAQLGAHFPEPMGPSLDYVIGKALKKDVLRLSTGYASWGFASNPVSFDDSNRLLAPYTKPQSAYDAIIAPINNAAHPPPPGKKARRDQFFSYLGRDTGRLLAKVSGNERLKLEGYLNALNNLGDRLNGQVSVEIAPSDIPARPGASAGFLDDLGKMLELVTLAFRADTHRVAVLGIGEQLPAWPWTDTAGKPENGNIWVSDFHHHVAHYDSSMAGETDSRLAFEGWCNGNLDRIVALAQSWKTIIDVDGRSLLDNTLIVLTGEVSNGQHETRNKTHILIGGGGGIKRGRWYRPEQIEVRNRQGFFLGGQQRDGTRIESTLNYGSTVSISHTGDLLAEIGRLAGVDMDTFGFGVNNSQAINLR